MPTNYNNKTHSGIQTLAPYIPGKSSGELKREMGITDIIKLASNENPLGCSPVAVEALKNLSAHQIATYLNPTDYELTNKLAKKLNVNVNNITLANGTDALFPLLMICFALNQDKHILTHKYSFMSYPIQAETLGVPLVITPLKENWSVDIDAIINAANAKTALIFIANPNNPTGIHIPEREIKYLLQKIPDSTILVLDEAYYEYLSDTEKNDTNNLLASHSNLIITRTFSKAYGLAGLRMGYAISNPEIAMILKKVMQPFAINLAAITTANAALDDESFIKKTIALNNKERIVVQQDLNKQGYTSLPSSCNFITFECKNNADKLFQYLLEQGIIIRPLKSQGLTNHLRVTIGTEEQNQRFIETLSTFKTQG